MVSTNEHSKTYQYLVGSAGHVFERMSRISKRVLLSARNRTSFLLIHLVSERQKNPKDPPQVMNHVKSLTPRLPRSWSTSH